MAVPRPPKPGSLRVAGYADTVAAPMVQAAGTDRGSGQRSSAPSIHEAALVGYLAVAATAGGFVLTYRPVARIGAARAELFADPVPFGAIAPGPVLGTGRPQPVSLEYSIG